MNNVNRQRLQILRGIFITSAVVVFFLGWYMLQVLLIPSQLPIAIPVENEDNQISPIITTTEHQDDNYKFMVALTVFINSTDSRTCGGVRIARAFVLTAAHCVDRTWIAMVKIGKKDLNEDDPMPLTFISKNFIIHEDYDNKTNENDIALIELFDDVNLSRDLQLAKLFQDGSLPYPKNQSILTVLGYGVKDSNYDNDLLQEKFVTLDSTNSCLNYKNKMSVICTDEKNGPYEGDSGGPLLYQNFIFGIVSSNTSNKTSYASVAYFHNWISLHIEPEPSIHINYSVNIDYYDNSYLIIVCVIAFICYVYGVIGYAVKSHDQKENQEEYERFVVF